MHLTKHSPPSCSFCCFRLMALALRPPRAPLGRQEGGTRPAAPFILEARVPGLPQDPGRSRFYCKQLAWVFWTITLLPDIGRRGPLILSRRHLRQQRAPGDKPLSGRSWAPASALGPVLTAGTRVLDKHGSSSRGQQKATFSVEVEESRTGTGKGYLERMRTWAVGRNAGKIETEPVPVLPKGARCCTVRTNVRNVLPYSTRNPNCALPGGRE